MSALSNDLESKLAKILFGGVAYTAPTSIYFALHTGDPTETGTANEVNTSGTGYARVGLTNNSTNFSENGTGLGSNAVAIVYAAATANWGTITHFSAWDALTGGNLLYYGSLNSSQAIVTNDVPRFNIGGIQMQFN